MKHTIQMCSQKEINNNKFIHSNILNPKLGLMFSRHWSLLLFLIKHNSECSKNTQSRRLPSLSSSTESPISTEHLWPLTFSLISETASSVQFSYLMSPDMLMTFCHLSKRIWMRYECHSSSVHTNWVLSSPYTLTAPTSCLCDVILTLFIVHTNHNRTGHSLVSQTFYKQLLAKQLLTGWAFN